MSVNVYRLYGYTASLNRTLWHYERTCLQPLAVKHFHCKCLYYDFLVKCIILIAEKRITIYKSKILTGHEYGMEKFLGFSKFTGRGTLKLIVLDPNIGVSTLANVHSRCSSICRW